MANDPLSHSTTDEEKRLAEKVQTRLSSGISYKTSRNLYEEWAEYQRFWDSDQWPGASGDTEQFPRPMTNHFNEIIEMKTAGLCYELPHMYYEPKKGYLKENFEIPVESIQQAEPVEGEENKPFTVMPSELLGHAADEVWDFNDMDQKVESLTRSGALLGDGLLFVDWNNEIQGGGEGSYIGEIEVMEIDITDFFVGDPNQQDLQKQPYMILTERLPINQVKTKYAEYGDAAMAIQPEGTENKGGYDHENIQQSETEYVNLIHYWEKSTEEEEGEVADTKITKKFTGINYFVVCQDYVLREERDFYLSKLYPFARFPWYYRRKSFYSKPESRDLINNQKELNRLQGIALLGAYKTGLPNIRYKEGFVKKEELSVGPGGNIIADETPPGQGWGVDYLQPPTIAAYIPLLKDSMAQGMKDTSGVHEAWSGKAPSAHLNASAIMALQEAAGVRIRPIQRRLYSALRDLGMIWLGMMMQHYTEDRAYKVYNKDGREGLAWFKVEDFKKMEFQCKVEMRSASPYSKTVIAESLERMVERGIIDGEIFIKMLPREVFPKAKELLELLQERIRQQQEMALGQQTAIISDIVGQTVEQAKASGTPLTPEVLEQMMGMIQQTAHDQEV
jgi:hypothetical protein